jgi:VanZ family protein
VVEGKPWLKPLRRRGFWLGLWLGGIVSVVVVCLLPGAELPKVPVSDKFEHALAFFALTAAAVQLFRRGKPLAIVALGLLALGGAIELAQAVLTTSRDMEAADLLADAAGIAVGVALAWTPLRDILLRIDHL